MQVEGHGRFEVAQFNADFAKNMIPRASCILAVGRKASDGRTPARIHAKRAKIERMTRVHVYYKGEGQFDDDNEWPDKYVKIFDGKFLGFGQQKIRGKLNVVAHIAHWAVDMNFSSALSSQSHPTNPADFTFQAILGGLITSGAAIGTPFGISQTAEVQSMRAEIVREDLWGKALKPMFCAIAKQQHVRITGDLTNCVGLDAGKNDLALQAIKRFEGVSKLEAHSDCDLALSCYTPKLALDIGIGVPLSVASAISQAILRETVDSWANNTLWGKLIVLAAQFGFSVIPLVDKAIVVPFTPGLRSTYCKQIDSDEYDHVDISGDIKRPVRAVAIQAGHDYNTGIGGAGLPPSSILGIGGCFSPADAEADGMIYIQRAPAWLEGVPSAGFSAARTLGLDGREMAASSTTPVDVNDNLKGAKDGADSQEVFDEVARLYNGYAHYLYMQEALRGRLGRIAGKLRFDIAPGSTVKLGGSSEKFLPGADAFGQDVIGDVVHVSISIDAESPRAGTAFQVNNCRTEEENKDDKTSLVQHPLYTTEFTGAPLVDDLQFPNKRCC